MSEKLPTIAFVTPTYGTIHRRVYESHLAAIGALAKDGIVVQPKTVIVTGKMGLASASNEIVRAILGLKPDYIFWTEMDMVLPPDAILKLFKHAQKYNLPILSGVYFLRGSGQPCLFRRNDMAGSTRFSHTQLTTFPRNSLFELKGTPGVGCVLFKREVFEQLSEPWWDDQEGKCGQDIYFYTMCFEKNIPVWVDTSVICDQIDDDEPRVWTIDDYQTWLKANSDGGFIQTGFNAISLEGEDSDKGA